MKQKADSNKGDCYALPCGKCPNCLRKRVSGWSMRLRQEMKVADTLNWITLTYATDNLKASPNGLRTLDKRDVQLFIKRLRRAHDKGFPRAPEVFLSRFRGKSLFWPKRIKYFAVGEYGSTFERPHYHILFYNVCAQLVETAWGLGSVHFDEITGGSIGYTLKYMMKDGIVPKFKDDDRKKEFQLMSKGLGQSYCTPQMVAWHKSNLLEHYFVQVDQWKISIPRYFKNKIYTYEELSIISGYYKGKMEQDMDLLMDRSSSEDVHNRIESNKAAFRRMHEKAEHGRKIY